MENAEPKKHMVEYLLENFDSIQEYVTIYENNLVSLYNWFL